MCFFWICRSSLVSWYSASRTSADDSVSSITAKKSVSWAAMARSSAATMLRVFRWMGWSFVYILWRVEVQAYFHVVVRPFAVAICSTFHQVQRKIDSSSAECKPCKLVVRFHVGGWQYRVLLRDLQVLRLWFYLVQNVFDVLCEVQYLASARLARGNLLLRNKVLFNDEGETIPVAHIACTDGRPARLVWNLLGLVGPFQVSGWRHCMIVSKGKASWCDAHELIKSKTQRICIGPKCLISSVSISPRPAPVPFLSCMSEFLSSLLVMRKPVQLPILSVF